MNNQYILQIKSIISEIEKTNELLKNFIGSTDIVDITMNKQINRKKTKLFKELLTVLISSNLSISSYENLYKKIITFLKNNEEQTIVSYDFKKNIQKAETLIT